jgi:transaldolase / glucose-6-phosphate isomerase
MDTTKRPVFSGDLGELYERELSAIREGELLKRLCSGDDTLWPRAEALSGHLRTSLEFLHIPARLHEFAETVLREETQARAEGLTDRVLIAFENAHHLCEALLNIHNPASPLRCMVMNSSHPSGIHRIESQIDIAKTLFLLVSKSGYRMGDHSLFLYFQKAIEQRVSASSSRHFVAGTEPNSFLATIARQYSFRYILELPPVIPALFCSLIDLTALLVTFAGVEPEVIRAACREIKRIYLEPSPGEHNPVCELAALLSATAARGRSFLVFQSSGELLPFAASLCRLVGGSLGKRTTGLYPLTEMGPCGTEIYEGKASVVMLKYAGKTEPFLEQTASELRSRAIPFLEIQVKDPLDLLRETFRWQLGTVLASTRMRVVPFDVVEPRLPRVLTAEMLNNFSDRNDTLKRHPRIHEGDILLFAEARARQEISQLNLIECLVSFFEYRKSTVYFGLYVFLDQNETVQPVFQQLRESLTLALGLPVLLAWGPRSLDSFGYLLRPEAPGGLQMMITADSERDIAIPGANYTFGQSYRAQALGHFEALSAVTGLALRLHLASVSAESLSWLQNLVQQALKRITS